MKHYSQKDIRWASQMLGTCQGWTIASGGCFITSFAMIHSGAITNPKGKVVECTPGALDWVATTKGIYSSGCNVVQAKFAALLGLKDNGKKTKAPIYPCIAETDHYKDKGIPQHFFVYLPDGTIVDPLDGNALNLWTPQIKKNPYHIVSYRWIEKVTTECNKCCPVHCPNNLK